MPDHTLPPVDPYHRQLQQIASLCPEGRTMALPRARRAHYPIGDTTLAAALLTLGIPWREPGPFTRHVVLDHRGEETSKLRTDFWVAAEGNGYKTETISIAWEHFETWKKENALHPLTAMRSVLDARQYWLDVLHHRRKIPQELRACPDSPYETDSIHGASLLVACGFTPLAFSGRAFYLEATHGGFDASQLLQEAANSHLVTPARWMALYLANLDTLLKIAKGTETIIQQTFGDRELLLTADATPRTREKFFRALKKL